VEFGHDLALDGREGCLVVRRVIGGAYGWADERHEAAQRELVHRIDREEVRDARLEQAGALSDRAEALLEQLDLLLGLVSWCNRCLDRGGRLLGGLESVDRWVVLEDVSGLLSMSCTHFRSRSSR
jgi:hypothetical protein